MNQRRVMKEFIRKLLMSTPLYTPLLKCRRLHQLRRWENGERSGTPPVLIKQRVLQEYAQRYHLKVLVETGTYFGETVEAMRGSFEKIYSIELSHELYARAKRRFRSWNHIEIIEGDSGIQLGSLLKRISQATLFWLDGHYFGEVSARGAKDCPILEELSHILESKIPGYVIIIDDACSFGSDPAYPTVQEVREYILSKRTDLEFDVCDDSMRVTPKQPADRRALARAEVRPPATTDQG